MIKRILCVAYLVYMALWAQAQIWSTVDLASIPQKGARDIIPTNCINYSMDAGEMKTLLWSAPDEFLTPVDRSNVFITVGLADGTADIFQMVEYDMMEIGLAAAYPDIRTFKGRSISDPYRTIRADWTTNGFRAVIRDLNGTQYIDPFQRNDLNHRIAYYRKDAAVPSEWSCQVIDDADFSGEPGENRSVGDCKFRSYRLAVATTGEYSNFFGATSSSQSALVLSQVTTAINRVNEVYEAEVGVRLILINNTNAIFFYSPGSDPYSGDACTQLNQNQTTVDNIIGSSNYDVGHVFSVGSGGCAQLNSICSSTSKARGATGLNPPTGDPFYIDYVAHELGHQFGGNHTQNNACNRNAGTAMEPGSASTIMGYAGICSPNVQSNSDPYFHGISLQEMAARITNTSCANIISTENSGPLLNNVPNYTIPISTPFVLTAVATDPDNDPLTYCWEQWDQEVGTMPPVSTSTLGPMFRSLLPSSSPSRYFYNLQDLVNNVNPTWEELPSVARMMEFRVTVRDKYDETYGCTDEDNTIITVSATSGPFTVTSQNTGATWLEQTTQTITWNVANTTASPVSCANVEIRLSYDGGFTYPTVLAESTPNDGSHTVTIPVGTTSAARVMVKAVDNIFFDINNANITIDPGVPNFTLALTPPSVAECNDGSVETTVNVGSFMGFSNPVSLTVNNLPPGASASFNPAVVLPGNTSTLTISNLGSLFGSYIPVVRGTSTAGSKDLNFPVTLLMPPASAPALVAPANNGSADLAPLLDWNAVAGFSQYDWEVASDADFTTVVASGTVTGDQAQLTGGLTSATTYWWRARANNLGCQGPWSAAWTFTTVSCLTFNSTNVPITIPPSGSPTINSILTINNDMQITDINVVNLSGTHTWVSDLRFTLISPQNEEVIIWNQPCTDHDNFNIQFDDEAPAGSWPCPPTNGQAYRPSNPLSAFDGGSSGGTWTLRVKDLFNQDGGSLNSWGLRVCGDVSCSLTVNQTSGTGEGSLPAAINCAATGDTIFLSPALAGQTINIGDKALPLSKSLTILAQGADIQVTGSGERVFEIKTGINVELNGLNLRAGTSLGGGAVTNNGNLTLKNVVIRRHPLFANATLVENTLSGQLQMEGNCKLLQ